MLREALRPLRRVNALVDANPQGAGASWSRSPEVGFVVMRATHKLLLLGPVDRQFGDGKECHRELVRLTAMLSLAPIRRLLLGFRIKSDSITHKVRELLLASIALAEDAGFATFRLWVATIALMEATGISEKAFFEREIRAAAVRLGVWTWEDAERHLMQGLMWCRLHSWIARPIWAGFC